MTDLNSLAEELAEKGRDLQQGTNFEVTPIPGDVAVFQILVEDQEELPLFLSGSDGQILCIAYLFRKHEVAPDSRDEMNEVMLAANVSMPLSSFALIDDQYVVFGALSAKASIEDVLHEIEVLSSNAIEAIDVLADYLL